MRRRQKYTFGQFKEAALPKRTRRGDGGASSKFQPVLLNEKDISEDGRGTTAVKTAWPQYESSNTLIRPVRNEVSAAKGYYPPGSPTATRSKGGPKHYRGKRAKARYTFGGDASIEPVSTVATTKTTSVFGLDNATPTNQGVSQATTGAAYSHRVRGGPSKQALLEERLAKRFQNRLGGQATGLALSTQGGATGLALSAHGGASSPDTVPLTVGGGTGASAGTTTTAKMTDISLGTAPGLAFSTHRGATSPDTAPHTLRDATSASGKTRTTVETEISLGAGSPLQIKESITSFGSDTASETSEPGINTQQDSSPASDILTLPVTLSSYDGDVKDEENLAGSNEAILETQKTKKKTFGRKNRNKSEEVSFDNTSAEASTNSSSSDKGKKKMSKKSKEKVKEEDPPRIYSLTGKPKMNLQDIPEADDVSIEPAQSESTASKSSKETKTKRNRFKKSKGKGNRSKSTDSLELELPATQKTLSLGGFSDNEDVVSSDIFDGSENNGKKSKKTFQMKKSNHKKEPEEPQPKIFKLPARPTLTVQEFGESDDFFNTEQQQEEANTPKLTSKEKKAKKKAFGKKSKSTDQDYMENVSSQFELTATSSLGLNDTEVTEDSDVAEDSKTKGKKFKTKKHMLKQSKEKGLKTDEQSSTEQVTDDKTLNLEGISDDENSEVLRRGPINLDKITVKRVNSNPKFSRVKQAKPRMKLDEQALVSPTDTPTTALLNFSLSDKEPAGVDNPMAVVNGTGRDETGTLQFVSAKTVSPDPELSVRSVKDRQEEQEDDFGGMTLDTMVAANSSILHFEHGGDHHITLEGFQEDTIDLLDEDEDGDGEIGTLTFTPGMSSGLDIGSES